MPHAYYRVPIRRRSVLKRDGEQVFEIPVHMVEKNDEIALGLMLLCHRKLFGECYQTLASRYFWSMPRGSGVLVAPFVPSSEILTDMAFPGDIDLLILPYEGNELLLSKAIAVELKVIRASFQNQGKSPARYGFSQAQSLLDHGFPYVAVIHLIVSDDSPQDAWDETLVAKLGLNKTVRHSWIARVDMMPANLVERSFGRLQANRKNNCIGVVSAYFKENQLWYPQGESTLPNPKVSLATMKALGEFYDANYNRFLDTPRYDPL